MSGGSYEYLYVQEARDLLDRVDTVQRMLEALPEGKAHQDTRRVLINLSRARLLLDRVDALVTGLAPVWKAVEWHESLDWGEDQKATAIEDYSNEQR